MTCRFVTTFSLAVLLAVTGPLRAHDPFNEMRGLFQEMERILDALDRGVTTSPAPRKTSIARESSVKLEDHNDALLITIELADVEDTSNLKVTVRDNVLYGRAKTNEKEIQFSIKDQYFRYTETVFTRSHDAEDNQSRYYASTASSESLLLPFAVEDWDAISATYDQNKGTLVLKLPKSALQTGRDVCIKFE